MFLVIALIVLIVSCIFYILFLRLWNFFTVIILNYFSGSFLISSLFIWSCEFLPCFFICPIFLCLPFFFLTYCIWSLLFPDLRDISLLPLVFALGGKGCFSGLCWFLVRGDMTLHCSGGGEFCFLFFFFLFQKDMAVWGGIFWSVYQNPVCWWLLLCFCLASWLGKLSCSVYAIGSSVIQGSVYNSRPSWIFSVINFCGGEGVIRSSLAVLDLRLNAPTSVVQSQGQSPILKFSISSFHF